MEIEKGSLDDRVSIEKGKQSTGERVLMEKGNQFLQRYLECVQHEAETPDRFGKVRISCTTD